MRTRLAVARGLEHALLGLLREHPMHAYEMHLQLLRTEQLRLVWHLKQGHLYALLAKLEAEGYLASTTEAQGTRPPRKMLRLTPRGETSFAAWMATPVEHGRDFRQEFLAKLYFATDDGPARVTELLTRQRQACHRWLGELHAQDEALSAGRPFEQLVVRFRMGQIEATLRWLEECAEVFATPATG
jgi:PadR family transcriptional regulator, regulatory protein AphA